MFSRRLIPLFPLAWMPFVLFFVHRRHTRERLGLCSSCGYPTSTSERCTECGSLIQRSRGSWSSTPIAGAILCVLLGAVATVLLAVSCPVLTYEGEHAEPQVVTGEWPPDGPLWCVTGLLSPHGCATFYAGKYDPVCDIIAPEPVESWLPDWSFVRASSLGRLYDVAGTWPAPDNSEAEIVEYATGWPWQALRAYKLVVFDYSESTFREIADLRWGVRVSDRVVPLLPIPAGFLLNTILFGAIWALIAFVPIASWHLTNRCSSGPAGVSHRTAREW